MRTPVMKSQIATICNKILAEKASSCTKVDAKRRIIKRKSAKPWSQRKQACLTQQRDAHPTASVFHIVTEGEKTLHLDHAASGVPKQTSVTRKLGSGHLLKSHSTTCEFKKSKVLKAATSLCKTTPNQSIQLLPVPAMSINLSSGNKYTFQQTAAENPNSAYSLEYNLRLVTSVSSNTRLVAKEDRSLPPRTKSEQVLLKGPGAVSAK